jgi:hypothetical protein
MVSSRSPQRRLHLRRVFAELGLAELIYVDRSKHEHTVPSVQTERYGK